MPGLLKTGRGVESVWTRHLVSADELVGEGQAGHQASLLQPEDRSERAREEDSLHGREGHHTLSWRINTTRRQSIPNPIDRERQHQAGSRGAGLP